MNKTTEKEWVKYTYDTNMSGFYNLYPFLDDDMFGKLKKIFSLLNINNILIDNVQIVDKTSRQYKINRFLSNNDDNFLFKYAVIEMKSYENIFKIEFVKSKKGIFTSLITSTKNNVIIKKENLNDYRAQVKILKNKIEKHNLTKDKIKSYVSNEILKINNNISDGLSEFIISYLDKYDMKFYDVNINSDWKNRLTMELFLKRKNKILKINVVFGKEYRKPYFYETFTVFKINSNYNRYNSFNDAYLDFITS